LFGIVLEPGLKLGGVAAQAKGAERMFGPMAQFFKFLFRPFPEFFWQITPRRSCPGNSEDRVQNPAMI
jgi:hypothetical protein